MKTVNIIGLGLIGASIAKKLKSSGHTVLGFDANQQVLQRALDENTIDAVADAPFSGVIILCTYPRAAIEFLHANKFENCIITDVLGIKANIVQAAEELGLNYVGMHPMAGKEVWGYENSCEDLFDGKNFILTGQSEEIERLAKDLGAGSVRCMTPLEHDKLIGFTSQLPHVIASAIILMEDYGNSIGATGGSLEDITRVGYINEHLWSQLFEENKGNLIPCIDEFIEKIKDIRDAIKNDNSEEILRQSRKKVIK